VDSYPPLVKIYNRKNNNLILYNKNKYESFYQYITNIIKGASTPSAAYVTTTRDHRLSLEKENHRNEDKIFVKDKIWN